MKPLLIVIISFFSMVVLNAQTIEELAAVRKGNSAYQQAEQLRSDAMQLIEKGGEVNTMLSNEKFKEAAKLYQDAEIFYRKGMATTKNFPKANYNLANTLYRQEKYEDAANSFKYIAEQKENDKSLRAKAYHNYGNALLKQEKYKESIDAYKNALKLQPNDKDTKYNLEYARKKLLQQQQQQQQDNKDNKDNQDNQDQQQQQQQQQQQENKDQDKEQQQQQQQKQQQQKQQQQQQQQQDKRQLDALQQNERQTQKKISEEEMKKRGKTKQEKDW